MKKLSAILMAGALLGFLVAPVTSSFARITRIKLKAKCPSGWKLTNYEKASGAYVCVPRIPKKKIICPKGTVAFKTGCSMGCKLTPN